MTFPLDFKESITLDFSSGNKLALTMSIPTCLAIYLALYSLSPVSIIGRIPKPLINVMASLESGLMTSLTAIIPNILS